MTKRASFALVIACVFSAVTVAPACGDKLLHLSRIHRQHPRSFNTTVLMFSRPGSLLENAGNLNLDKPFREDGYSLLVVKTDRELRLAIESRVPDVVMVDIADAPLVEGLRSPVPLLIIPVLTKGNRQADTEAKRFTSSIKAPLNSGKCLDALEQTLDSKLGRQTAKLQLVRRSE